MSKIKSFGIRAKLILIFIVIKVIPLLLLAAFAWRSQVWLADHVSDNVQTMAKTMGDTVTEVADHISTASVRALDASARETLERLTTDAARSVAAFLYDRDHDILSAAQIDPTEDGYRRFLAERKRRIETHHPWVPSPDGSKWIPGPDATPRYDEPNVTPSAEDNARNFNYRPPAGISIIEDRPLFLEMTFIGLDGKEQIKVTTSPRMAPELRDVSNRLNTYVKAEDYFPKLQALKPGEIYVSDVIGAYVPTHMIGPYTPQSAKTKNMAFEPEQSAYAGTENPVGKRFEGLVRWATPVSRQGQIIGWVSLALDHDHLMEFTNHILPTSDRYSPIPDAASGNYAFIWDYKGRSIVHPRHYFITGFDPQTGEPAVPWLDSDLYSQWQASGKPIREFLETAPTFLDQSLKKKGSTELVKAGLVGLDCRYLNHAPQCSGWMDLTQHGGSGSFEIFWSGLWKLTTAAAIPYYTGPYADSPRGFGFVTIGANVDDFHRAATEARQSTDKLIAERSANLHDLLSGVLKMIHNQVSDMTRQLSGSTILMSVLVIGIAIWMASFLTEQITTMISGIRRFEDGDLSHRLPVTSHDEMANLANSFNQMADRVQESFTRLTDARHKAEEASRMKSEFLANMSHELRTPLNGIIGFAELLRDDAPDEESKENAEIIERSSRHLLDLVNSILDIAKIEAGAMVLNLQPVDLSTLGGEVAAVHQPVAAAKGLGFRVILEQGVPPTLPADPTRLRQILHNLLNNAVKFTDKGSVSLTIEGHPSTADHGPEVEFRVTDTGPGISKEMQDSVFEKFRQGDSFLTRSHGGTGLGLSLARHLTTLMGGSLTLESELGQGTTFRFILPVNGPNAQVASNADTETDKTKEIS